MYSYSNCTHINNLPGKFDRNRDSCGVHAISRINSDYFVTNF